MQVVYRGYNASDVLEKMHEGAVEQRTKLRLQQETGAGEALGPRVPTPMQRSRCRTCWI